MYIAMYIDIHTFLHIDMHIDMYIVVKSVHDDDDVFYLLHVD